MLKHHRLLRLFGRQISERDFGEAAFLRSEAGPESGVDDRRDRLCIGLRRQIVLAEAARLLYLSSEMCLDDGRDGARRLIRWVTAHKLRFVLFCLLWPDEQINAGEHGLVSVAGCPYMRKVLVIGPGGSGKSTFARRLGELLEIQVKHLDAFYWRAGWTKPSNEDWVNTVTELASGDAWIMDGNFGGTLELRLEHCDTIIFLDMPRLLCLWRVTKRRLRYRNRSRPDMAEG